MPPRQAEGERGGVSWRTTGEEDRENVPVAFLIPERGEEEVRDLFTPASPPRHRRRERCRVLSLHPLSTGRPLPFGAVLPLSFSARTPLRSSSS